MRGKRIKQFILILCMVCLFGMNVQAEDVYTEFHVDNQKGKAGDVVPGSRRLSDLYLL